jgi:hypothetical protein
MRRVRWATSIMVLCGFLCTGCALLKSELVSTSNDVHGLVYSLPMGQVLLTASRTQISPNDLQKAQAAVAQVKQALAKDAQAVAAAGGDTGKLALAQASQAADQASLTAAQTAVDIAANKQNKWQETATLTLLPIAPDPTARYVSDLDHELSRDDTLKLSVINGLLSSTTLTSTDQTPNLIVQTADTVITALAMAGGGIPKPQAPTIHPTDCSYSISEVFDPLNRTQVDNVNKALQSAGAQVLVAVPSLSDATQLPADQGLPPATGTVAGIVYRVATPVVVQIAPNSLPGGLRCELATPSVAAQSITAIVPDTRSRYFVSSQAGPFTTTNLTFGFSSGLLTDYSVQRPSELAAVVGIPVTIANHIMQIPAQVIQARVNYDTQATALVNAQTTLKKAQIEQSASLASAMADVVNAQAALKEAEINKPASVIKAETALVQAQEALQKAIQSASSAASK